MLGTKTMLIGAGRGIAEYPIAAHAWDGNISQVGLWQGVLTQAEIQSVMEKTFEELTATEKSSLGAELFADPTCENSGSWTLNLGWDIDTTNTGKVTAVDVAGGAYAYITTTTVEDALYKFTFEVESLTAGTLRVLPDTTNFTVNSTGIKTFYFTASGTSHLFGFQSTGTTSCIIDNISVKKVTHDLVSYWALDGTIESSGIGNSAVYDLANATLGDEVYGDPNFEDASYLTIAGVAGSEILDVNTTNAGKMTAIDAQDVDVTKSGILVAGQLYRLEFVVDTLGVGGGNDSGRIRFERGYTTWFTGLSSAEFSTGDEGTWIFYGFAVNTNFGLRFDITSTFTMTSMSIKPVNGNAGVLI